MSQELEKKGIVPSRAFGFSGERSLAFVLSQDIEGRASDHGEIRRTMIPAGALPIFVVHDIQHPVQAGLDPPVSTHLSQQDSRLRDLRENEKAGVGEQAPIVVLADACVAKSQLGKGDHLKRARRLLWLQIGR